MRFTYGPNRFVCSVLEELREANKKLNHFTLHISKKHMASLIEEAQTAVNRMEAGLNDIRDVEELKDKRRELSQECTRLHAEIEILEKKRDELD